MNKNYKKITLLILSTLLLLNVASPIFANNKKDTLEETVEKTEMIIDGEDVSDVEEELIEEIEMIEEGHLDLGLVLESEDVEEDTLSIDEVKNKEVEESIIPKAEEPVTFNEDEFDPGLFSIDYDIPGVALLMGVSGGVHEKLFVPGEYDFGSKGVRHIVLRDTRIFRNKTKHLVIEEVNGHKVGLQITNLWAGFSEDNIMESADLRGLDVSAVTHMPSTFARTSALKTLNVEGWDTSNVVDMTYMFYYASKIEELELNSWDVSSVKDMSNMFSNVESLHTIHFADWQLGSVEKMNYMFYGGFNSKLRNIDVSRWKTPNAREMRGMFWSTRYLKFDVSEWDVSNVETMSKMFYYTRGITSLDLRNWDVKKVKDFYSMFADSHYEELHLDNWQTDSAENFDRMFAYNEGLSELNINHFNTENVTDTSMMFSGLKLRSLDLSNWDVRNVTNMDKMFYRSPDLKVINLKNWKTNDAVSLTDIFNDYRVPGFFEQLDRVVITSDEKLLNYDYTQDENQPLLISSFNANTLEDNGVMHGSFADGDLVKEVRLSKFYYSDIAEVEAEMNGFMNDNVPTDLRSDSEARFMGWTASNGGTVSNFIQRYIQYGKERFDEWADAIISYNANTTDSTLIGTVPEDKPFKLRHAVDVDLNSGNLERLGYHFKGWTLNPSPEKTDVIYGLDELTIIPTESITLYAVWEEHEQTIKWHLNNGGKIIETTQNTGDTISVISDPSKEGYTFEGWYVDEALTLEIPRVMEALEKNADINFYAKYVENKLPTIPDEKEDLEDEEKTEDKEEPNDIIDSEDIKTPTPEDAKEGAKDEVKESKTPSTGIQNGMRFFSVVLIGSLIILIIVHKKKQRNI